MKILFSMRHSGALRNFASTISELASRGHDVHLAFMMQDKLGDGRLLWELSNDYVNVTYGELGKKTPWRFWLGLARGVRAAADYVRYGTPEYKRCARAARARGEPCAGDRCAASWRCRWCARAPGCASSPPRSTPSNAPFPTDRFIADLIAEQKPDCVLVTPLVDIGSDQVEYVKATKSLGMPQRPVRAQLGQPHQQGADPHRARPRLRLERGAEARGGRRCMAWRRSRWW